MGADAASTAMKARVGALKHDSLDERRQAAATRLRVANANTAIGRKHGADVNVLSSPTLKPSSSALTPAEHHAVFGVRPSTVGSDSVGRPSTVGSGPEAGPDASLEGPPAELDTLVAAGDAANPAAAKGPSRAQRLAPRVDHEQLSEEEDREAALKAGAVGRRGSRRCSSGSEWSNLAREVGTSWAAANPAAAAALVSANPSGSSGGLGVRRPATVDSQRGARRGSRRTPAQPPRPSGSAGLFSTGVPLSPASRAASRALQHVESGRELLFQALTLTRALALTPTPTRTPTRQGRALPVPVALLRGHRDDLPQLQGELNPNPSPNPQPQPQPQP